jgi:hypothetical protein
MPLAARHGVPLSLFWQRWPKMLSLMSLKRHNLLIDIHKIFNLPMYYFVTGSSFDARGT